MSKLPLTILLLVTILFTGMTARDRAQVAATAVADISFDPGSHPLRDVPGPTNDVRSSPTSARSEDIAPQPAIAIKDYGLKEYVHLSRALPHSEHTDWKLVRR